MLLKMLVGIAAGAMGHKALYDPFDRLGPRTGETARKASGVLITLPVFLWMEQDLQEISSPRKRMTVAYCLAFLAVGAGAVLMTAFEHD